VVLDLQNNAVLARTLTSMAVGDGPFEVALRQLPTSAY